MVFYAEPRAEVKRIRSDWHGGLRPNVKVRSLLAFAVNSWAALTKDSP